MTQVVAQGFHAQPTLDGIQLLGVRPEDFVERSSPSAIDTLLNSGSLRRTVFFKGNGLPDLHVSYQWTSRYKTISRADQSTRAFIQSSFSSPGLHTWSPWRAFTVSWTSGGGNEFALPWGLATEGPLPAEDPTGTLLLNYASPDATDSTGWTVLVKSTLDYDAGDPAVDEAWIDNGTKRIKAEPGSLAPGDKLYGRFFPLFSVYLSSATQKDIKRTLEPEELTVLQAD